MDGEQVSLAECSPQNKRGRKARKIESEWLPTEIERLIYLVENEAALWNPTQSGYKDRPLRERTFDSIGKELQRSASDCRQKWENLRAQFGSYHAKAKQQKSGQGAEQNYKVSWKYFEAMKFLIVVYEASSKTVSNLSDDAESSCSYMIDLTSTKSNSKKRKINEAESNTDTDKYIAKAMSVLDKSDSAQIFGDYVADRLRQLKDGPAEEIKDKITLLILEALKAERNSDPLIDLSFESM